MSPRINKYTNILEGYDGIRIYHLYCTNTNPLVYMTILQYIALARFKDHTMLDYYMKVGTLESNYLNPIYYINGVEHIRANAINYCDSDMWKGTSNSYDLVLLHFNQQPKEHGKNHLTLECTASSGGTFNTIIHLNVMEESQMESLTDIILTMTVNGIVSDVSELEEEEVDLQ